MNAKSLNSTLALAGNFFLCQLLFRGLSKVVRVLFQVTLFKWFFLWVKMHKDESFKTLTSDDLSASESDLPEAEQYEFFFCLRQMHKKFHELVLQQNQTACDTQHLYKLEAGGNSGPDATEVNRMSDMVEEEIFSDS